MKEHFQTLYDRVPLDHFVYDSKRLGKVRQFATSNQLQIMVINIQSFQKDVADKDMSEMTEEELTKLNVINRENDRMSGRRPIEFIQARQSHRHYRRATERRYDGEVETGDPATSTHSSRCAIAQRTVIPYNLLYKLDPDPGLLTCGL